MDNKNRHLIFWWSIKLICSILLIVCIFLNYFTSWYPAILNTNNSYPVYLILLGGGTLLYHYYLIKLRNKEIDEALELVTEEGLFTYVRHPMYFGDILMVIGYTLMACSIASLCILLLAVIALVKQAQVEDIYLANKHKIGHATWSKSTKLVIPYIY